VLVNNWCEERGLQPGGIIPLDTCWRLARAWYHDRLEESWRRKSAEEVRELFETLGLTSDFWQL